MIRHLAILGLAGWALCGAAPAPAGPQKDPRVPFRTLLKAPDGGPRKACELVIRTPRAWADFLKTCSSEAVRKGLRAKRPNFARETVIVVAFGPSDSSLQEHEHKDSGVREIRREGRRWLVDYTVVASDEKLDKTVYPLHVVKTAKAGAIRFRKTDRSEGG